MISARGIYKKFQNIEVLKGVDFEAQEREVISIIGSSGAGKTTFLQILGTLLRPDAGTIVFNGQDLSELNDTELSRFRNQNIGFIYQFHNLLPEFTAIENICIPGFIGKGNVQEVKKRAEELMHFLKIHERKDHKPSELSGGEQQRVAVARALINQPNIIMADEPSGNLDSENKTELHQLFFDLKAEFGQTFIIVTHDDSLAKMADRTLKMKDGKFV